MPDVQEQDTSTHAHFTIVRHVNDRATGNQPLEGCEEFNGKSGWLWQQQQDFIATHSGNRLEDHTGKCGQRLAHTNNSLVLEHSMILTSDAVESAALIFVCA
jgi:hypothetical protein